MPVMSKVQENRPNDGPILWVVATPLGHLSDLSPRAREILESADLIAAEDTRMTQRLVARSASQRWLSINEHSEERNVQVIMDALEEEKSVALVSDAGTPLISDPGYRVVSAAHAKGFRVSPIPGPCAAVAALSAAGLPSDRFHFEGFLPAKRSARQTRLRTLAQLPHTWIVYVPARDLKEVVDDMLVVLDRARPITLARELTKRFETVKRLEAGQMNRWLAEDEDQLKGEAVLVVGGCPNPHAVIEPSVLAQQLKSVLPPSKAAAVLAKVSTLSRQDAWTLVMGQDEEELE